MQNRTSFSLALRYTLQDWKNALPSPINSALHQLKLAASRANLKVENAANSKITVDSYWGENTVIAPQFANVQESIRFLDWRFNQYPLFREKMNLYAPHEGQTILDYGCGPGNDLTGFSVYSKPKKIVGIDISAKALAKRRLELHQISTEAYELIQTHDIASEVPLENSSVDYIHCAGVLHHTTEPEKILSEFYRVLKPGGQGCIMVYNHDSIWLHLYVAYQLMILNGMYSNMTVEGAFGKTTDGEDCPLAIPYHPAEFIALCEDAGLRANYEGAYFHSYFDLWGFKTKGKKAIQDRRLAEEHRQFLEAIVYDSNGFPTYNGKHAGCNGIYRIHEAPK